MSGGGTEGTFRYAYQCLLIGHDQTCRGRALTAEFDPFRTSGRNDVTPFDHLVDARHPRATLVSGETIK